MNSEQLKMNGEQERANFSFIIVRFSFASTDLVYAELNEK
jgi:hypothetical protein